MAGMGIMGIESRGKTGTIENFGTCISTPLDVTARLNDYVVDILISLNYPKVSLPLSLP